MKMFDNSCLHDKITRIDIAYLKYSVARPYVFKRTYVFRAILEQRTFFVRFSGTVRFLYVFQISILTTYVFFVRILEQKQEKYVFCTFFFPP